MNSKKYNILLAGLMCVGLGACGTAPDRSNASTINSGELYGETAGGIGMVTGPAMAGAGSAGVNTSSTRSGASGSAYGSGTSSGGATYGSGTTSGGAAMSPSAAPAGSAVRSDMSENGLWDGHFLDWSKDIKQTGSAAVRRLAIT